MSKPKHGDSYSFDFNITLDELIYLGGMEDMNEYMDEKFEDKIGNSRFSLTDISYDVKSVEAGDIVITATGIIDDFDFDRYEEER